jgi:hypothetical protein
MGYTVIEGFPNGLDTRKSRLTAAATSLTNLKNAHITSGGEIEKRKAFVAFCAAGLVDTNGDQGTFGLQALASTLVVFGSALDYDAADAQAQPKLAAPIPATDPEVVYQQLKHPAVADGADYDRTKHRLTAVLCSEQFGGVAWTAASFADERTFAFRDGVCVPAWRNGQVFSGRTTPEQVAAQLKASLDRELSGYLTEISNNAVDLKAPAGKNFGAIVADASAAGVLAYTQMSAGDPDGTVGRGASCMLNFTGGSTGSFTSLLVPDGAGDTVELLGAAVAWSASLNNTVGLLALMINSTVTSPKYIASASGSNLTLSAPASLGDAVNGLAVVLTHNGDYTLNAVGTLILTASVAPTTLSREVFSTDGTVLTSAVATTAVAGGTAGFTYQWQEWTGSAWVSANDPLPIPRQSPHKADGSSPSGIIANSPTSAATTFRKYVAANSEVSGSFRCKVTDSGAPNQSAYTPTVHVSLMVSPPSQPGRTKYPY